MLEQRCTTLAIAIAITRPHAARALRHDARRRSPVIESWKPTSQEKRRRDAPRTANPRACAVAPNLRRPRISWESVVQTPDGRMPAQTPGRPVVIHSGGG
ncbi:MULTISPECIES: hypothetical protein [Burkholderia]|uniref:hypothetical protein n=1 Tax=Burkholderia TaxID=32008 RepID=UPI00158A0398|nr:MULTISPECIES: hypothetical protein [Burkholderia]MCU9953496.1 hypothetical protein [Burkholderia sp. BKH01]